MLSSKMRIVYVPRMDAEQIGGGDIVYMLYMKRFMQRLGVEIDVVPANKLKHHAGGDLVHLTQIYQLDLAETALKWACGMKMPVVVNPLFEEVLAMWFRWAIRRQTKWRNMAKVCGLSLAEFIYTRWQTARRLDDPGWKRQRDFLHQVHVVPNTRYELQHLRNWFNLPGLFGTIVPLGVDAAKYGVWKATNTPNIPSVLREQKGKYILEVGVISMRKNQIGLLQALAHTRDPIVFLGRPTPNEPEYFEELTTKAKARGHVTFLDYVEEPMLPALFGNARVHVLPSWSERPGLVSLEAAACGTKVVSSNRAPVHEYLEQRAWYIDPAQPDQMRATLQTAMMSETPSGLREHALRFDWENTAQKLTDVYTAILQGGMGGA